MFVQQAGGLLHACLTGAQGRRAPQKVTSISRPAGAMGGHSAGRDHPPKEEDGVGVGVRRRLSYPLINYKGWRRHWWRWLFVCLSLMVE